MKIKFSAIAEWFICEMTFTLWIWKWYKFRKHIAFYNVECVEGFGRFEKTFTLSGTGKEIMKCQSAWASCV